MAIISASAYRSTDSGANWYAVDPGSASQTNAKGASEQTCYVFSYVPTTGFKATVIAFTVKMKGISGYNWTGPWTAELYDGERPNDKLITSASTSGQLVGDNYTDVTFVIVIPDGVTLDKEMRLCIGLYAPGRTTVWTGTVDVTEAAAYIDVIYTYGGEEIVDKKTPSEALTLRGVSFYRNGYTQIGWSSTEGGEISHSFGESYTADEALTLYPVWGIAPSTVLWLLLRRIEKTRKQRMENNSNT